MTDAKQIKKLEDSIIYWENSLRTYEGPVEYEMRVRTEEHLKKLKHDLESLTGDKR